MLIIGKSSGEVKTLFARRRRVRTARAGVTACRRYKKKPGPPDGDREALLPAVSRTAGAAVKR
jgi:hypothetical protein